MADSREGHKDCVCVGDRGQPDIGSVEAGHGLIQAVDMDEGATRKCETEVLSTLACQVGAGAMPPVRFARGRVTAKRLSQVADPAMAAAGGWPLHSQPQYPSARREEGPVRVEGKALNELRTVMGLDNREPSFLQRFLMSVDQTSLLTTMIKYLFVAAVVCGLVIGGRIVEKFFTDTDVASSRAHSVPPGPAFVVMSVVNFRKLVFPLYCLFPVGTVSKLYVGIAIGSSLGALFLQCIRIQDMIIFFLLRRIYTKLFSKILEDKETPADPPKLCYCCTGSRIHHALPAWAKAVLKIYDQGWQRCFSWFNRHWLLQGSIIVALMLSSFMDDLVILIWLATRSKVSFKVFAVFFTIGVALDFFRTKIKIEMFLAVAKNAIGRNSLISADDESFLNVLTAGLDKVPVSDYIVAGILGGISTIFVHGVNIGILCFFLYNKMTNRGKDDSSQGDIQGNSCIDLKCVSVDISETHSYTPSRRPSLLSSVPPSRANTHDISEADSEAGCDLNSCPDICCDAASQSPRRCIRSLSIPKTPSKDIVVHCARTPQEQSQQTSDQQTSYNIRDQETSDQKTSDQQTLDQETEHGSKDKPVSRPQDLLSSHPIQAV